MAQNQDWYRRKLSELDSWHTTFAAQCTATGAAHGLTAAQVAQAGVVQVVTGVPAPILRSLQNDDYRA